MTHLQQNFPERISGKNGIIDLAIVCGVCSNPLKITHIKAHVGISYLQHSR